ncbi:MAG: MBL fold metallo-hydrolase [Lachnospiraceae bacterium]|nr:MBL fold metallo-hydrolase [Lachnospiraceae bacterium]
MKEIVTNIIKSIDKYFEGNYLPVVVFVVSLLAMFWLMKKKKESKEVVLYSIILTVVILCPITAKIIMFGIGKSVYWRMFWLYPAVPVVAVILTHMIQKIANKYARFAVVCLCCIVIALCGNSAIARDEFSRATNFEKVPEYVVAVCDMINEDAKEQGIENKKLATCADFLMYVRQYDGTLQMENSRENIRGYDDREYANLVFRCICGSEPVDYDAFAWLLREEKCSYVVLNLEFQEEMSDALLDRGFTPVGYYDKFIVYRDGLLNAKENIEKNETVVKFSKEKSGYLIGQYSSLTGDQASFYTITDAQNHLILIDGGWDGDAEYVRKVIEYFGGKVDAWIITHPHFDHVRAFNKLLASADCPQIDAIYASEFDYDTYKEEAKKWDHFEDFENFIAVTKDRDNLYYLHEGDEIDLFGLKVDVYHDYTSKDGGDAANDGSLVFEISGNEQSMLFCADTGEAQSETIIENYGEKLSADYLQLGHHGNGGLNEKFYRMVSPKVAFFDAPEWLMNPEQGTNYTTPENIALMEELGAKIYSFDSAPNFVVLK